MYIYVCFFLVWVCAAAGRTIRLSVGDWLEEMLAGHIHGSWRAKQVNTESIGSGENKLGERRRGVWNID